MRQAGNELGDVIRRHVALAGGTAGATARALGLQGRPHKTMVCPTPKPALTFFTSILLAEHAVLRMLGA